MSGFENLISIFRIITFFLWTMFWLPVQVVALAFDVRLSWLIPKLYHQGNCFILGLRVICHGVPTGESPVLFVSNHMSYLDIVVLAAHLEASFVAKQEVAHWPLFGLLARLNRTVFVQRKAGRSSVYRDEMRHRLASGKSLILFPEGTSSDGNRVLGFNSTFFSVAETEIEGKPVRVQPLAIAYTQLHGLPIGRSQRPIFAWYGDMDLMSHLWAVFGQGAVTVELAFLPYVTMENYSSRKHMAQDCQSMVADCVSDMLGGQPIRLVQAST